MKVNKDTVGKNLSDMGFMMVAQKVRYTKDKKNRWYYLNRQVQMLPYRAQWLADWFDELENNVNHRLWPLNPTGRF